MEPLDPELNSLVVAERGEVEPSAGDRERVRRSLAVRVGIGVGVGAGLLSSPAAGAAAAAGSGVGLALKVGLAVAVLGGAALVSVPRLVSHDSPRAPAVRVAPAASPAQVVPIAPAQPAAAEVSPSPEPAAARPSGGGSAAHALPPLAEEARLLKQAQQALRDGQPGAALTALSEHQRRFPTGQLSLERGAARISALCALGRNQQAEREAKAFVTQHPGSGLSAQVRASCGLATSKP